MSVFDVLGKVKKRAEGLVTFRICWNSVMFFFVQKLFCTPETQRRKEP